MIYSLVGDPFREWVSKTIKKRNDTVASKNDLMIELDPAIAKAFQRSINISSKWNEFSKKWYQRWLWVFLAVKGRGVHILKPGSKRRRTRDQMNLEEAYDDALQSDL